jgi:hypothetical protein
MKVPNAWDDKGKPTGYFTIKDDDFVKAATKVSDALSSFLTTLSTALKDNSGDIEDILDDLNDGGIGSIMQALGSFIRPVMEMAGGKIQIGSEMIDIDNEKIKQAATAMSEALVNFLSKLPAATEILKNVSIDDIVSNIQSLTACVKEIVDL